MDPSNNINSNSKEKENLNQNENKKVYELGVKEVKKYFKKI